MSLRTGVMLARPATPKLLDKLGPIVYTQPKLDGDRCRAVPCDFGYRLVSSQGNSRNAAVPHIVGELTSLAASIFGLDTDTWPELDGELYVHGMSHQQIRSITSRTANIHPKHRLVEYHIFDTCSRWLPQSTRIAAISLFAGHGSKFVKVVNTAKHLNNMDDLIATMNTHLDAGYEGVIVRAIDGEYEAKRSNNLLKMKPVKSGTATILRCIEAISLEGEPKGMLGSFWVSGLDKRNFRVSAGRLNHIERTTAWERRDELVGYIVAFRYLTTTDLGLPREPVAVSVHVCEGGGTVELF
jgi:ATP-dependent DNA ligase